MSELNGKQIISHLQRKWTISQWLIHFVSVSAITFLLSSLLIAFFGVSWICIPVTFIVLSLITFRFLYKKITEKDVADFLNNTFPELQESTGLLIKPNELLNPLEKLQLHKIEDSFPLYIKRPKKLTRSLSTAIILFFAALLTWILLSLFPPGISWKKNGSSANNKIDKIENKPPQVDEVTIRIVPPSYTGKGIREQHKFNLTVEEGSGLAWHITTTAGVKDLALVFNDRSLLPLNPINKEHTEWTASKLVLLPGFYQVKTGETLSELYRIDMIKDQPPVIVVQSPKPNLVIPPWEQPVTKVEIAVSDDYGIKNTFISATMASGNGEAVKFKEQQFTFANFVAGNNKYALQKQLDLKSLGMKAGDELYLYISATDSHNQEKRSDIFIIRLEDTAQLMSIEGMASGVDLKPEFFRSQRQIIIETEQLLKEKDTMRVEVFTQRSNDLGVDQKLLRLRYGKFLGEETDAEIGKDHDHEGSANTDVADFGNAQKMMDAVAHKHDNAEDAGFFDAQTKKQLKATLDEMWKAELQLRTIKPKNALPFEYAALRLLKELQQQTRVYVAKTGVRTTPLKPEKRLTGELDKIIQPVQQQNLQQVQDEVMIERQALGVLEQVRNKETLQPGSLHILEQAAVQISVRAAEEPAVYLSSFEAMRRILKNNYKTTDLQLTGNTLQKMITGVAKRPSKPGTNADLNLSQQYFMNLNRQHD